ncbi:hypothetical protein SAMN05216410_1865 [Sanguibacter gelidistatuariae]|uniref:Heavy metal transporter n=1 Tax=Sanguibacter gelidistatuariae TaxID=1814289 RepID=A0A1G6MFB2_9MICO|nr:hypothetical protein SAMN05216410_1865 [Sanguibacter gelidistatuariae]
MVVVAVAVGGVVLLLQQTTPQAAPRQDCTAALDGATWRLSPAQADNAALITAVSLRREMPARAATIALATALQESKLVNIDYGDRDSVGLFQQRTSQGWGTVEEIMDPVFSTNAFFDGLEKVPGYTELPVTEAAQAVQRSGFPDAYAQHEVRSRAWAAGLTGQNQASVVCTLTEADPVAAGDPAAIASARATLSERVARDFGDLAITEQGAASIVVDVTSLAPTSDDVGRLAWALAQWGVASAQATGVESVTVGGHVWSRDDGTWSTDQIGAETSDGEGAPTLAESSVLLTLAVR